MGTGVSPRRIITGNLMKLYGATLRVVAHSWLCQLCYTFKTEYKLQIQVILFGQALDLLVLVS